MYLNDKLYTSPNFWNFQGKSLATMLCLTKHPEPGTGRRQKQQVTKKSTKILSLPHPRSEQRSYLNLNLRHHSDQSPSQPILESSHNTSPAREALRDNANNGCEGDYTHTKSLKLYIYSKVIHVYVFRFHDSILFFHSTRYAEEIKRTNLVGEINSQEGSRELKWHMIWDDSDVKSLVINGHTTCTAIFLNIFTYIFAGWMDTLCGSTCATKSYIRKLTETGRT